MAENQPDAYQRFAFLRVGLARPASSLCIILSR